MLLAVGAGCTTPRSRYEALSFFFDGVPDPDAPVVVAEAGGKSPRLSKPRETSASGIVSVHRPYAEGLVDREKCIRCHASLGSKARGDSFSFVDPSRMKSVWGRCLDCHAKAEAGMEPKKAVAAPGGWLHGPIASGHCQPCHEGHESRFPSLLRAARMEPVCLECHADLAPRSGPMAALDCTACHDPHRAGSAGDRFLRGGPAAACRACHEPRTAERPWTHAPFAAGECNRCHDSHGAPGAANSVRRPISGICNECHGGDDPCAGAKEAAPRDCDACHDPHAAPRVADRFLRDRMPEEVRKAGAFRPATGGR